MTMQIARLLEIVYILMDRKTVTAAELAERFEVSARTVYRDIEALSMAGIPVYTVKGKGGGIRLADGFVLDKSLLTEREQREILAALQALGATRFAADDKVLDKLGHVFQKTLTPWIKVDFSDWSQDNRKTFDEIKGAILERRLVAFDYFSSYGEKTARVVEPMFLWFKHRSWYLRAFDRGKNDERIFKLSRVKGLRGLEETFVPSAPRDRRLDPAAERKKDIVRLRMRVDASQLYRVYDEFDESMIVKAEDGSFVCEALFPEDEWVYGFVLSFGHYAEVLEPPHTRAIVRERAEKICGLYKI